MFWKTKAFERYAPASFGFLAFALVAIFRIDIARQFLPHGWDATSLYSAVFNWASIQSGFVFGIYGFIVTKKEGFVGEFAKTRSFEAFLIYARRAYLTGFALTFVSLPIMVASPSIADAQSPAFWVVCVWFGCFIWTFCAFLRVAFIFGIVSAVADRRPEIVG